MNALPLLRQALRSLARSPGFSIAAIGMLTLGIGLGVAMFSALGGVVLRGLPFPQSDRLMVPGVLCVLLLAALLAVALPARRALRVDPMAALRYE